MIYDQLKNWKSRYIQLYIMNTEISFSDYVLESEKWVLYNMISHLPYICKN